MTRFASLALALASAAVLVGCTPGTPAPTPSASGSSASPSASPSPASTPTSTVSAPAAPVDPLAGTCDELLTPAQISALVSPDAVSQGDTTSNGGGRASTETSILAAMPTTARHCTWTIPGTDGGLIVSVFRADAGVRAGADVAVGNALGLFQRDAAAGVHYWSFEALDSFIFTETHAIGEGSNDLWVAAFTTGSNSREIAQIVWESFVSP